MSRMNSTTIDAKPPYFEMFEDRYFKDKFAEQKEKNRLSGNVTDWGDERHDQYRIER